jgi:diadenosine tetraphosphatase ApaH/serine/threonine PP2A family protein phosphatase
MEISFTIQNLFLIYSDIASTDAEMYANKKKRLILPKITQVLLSQICNQAASAFQQDKMVIEINEEVIIVGDLHGHILDLLRILNTFGMPPNVSYLFLGDLVDRGDFSLETVTLILVMKILFPKNVFVVRGNHEFTEMCEYCGFYEELSNVYGNTLVRTAFNHCFSYIPFAAIVQKSYLCVHGGIGPTLENIDQIKEIQRPILDYNAEPILSLLWSDPDSSVTQFRASQRGLGFVFGYSPLVRMLKHNGLTCLIRGHECVQEGMETQLKGKCITVFSASNYCNLQPNKAAVLTITHEGVRKPTYFTAMKYLFRTQALFVQTDCKTTALKVETKKTLPRLNTSAKTSAESELGESGKTQRSIYMSPTHQVTNPLFSNTPRSKLFKRSASEKRLYPPDKKSLSF